MCSRAQRYAGGLARLADQRDPTARRLEAEGAAERLEFAIEPERERFVHEHVEPILHGIVGQQKEDLG